MKNGFGITVTQTGYAHINMFFLLNRVFELCH